MAKRSGRANWLGAGWSNKEKDSKKDAPTLKYQGRTYSTKQDNSKPLKEISQGEPQELDRNYQEIVAQVASQGKNKKEQEAIGNLLLSPNAVETYDIMRESGMSKRQIRDTYLYGVNDLAKGKKFSEATLYRSIAQRLETLEGYEGVIEEMHDEGILSERDYQSITSTVNDYRGQARKSTGRAIQNISDLEKKANAVNTARKIAAVVLMTLGAFLFLLSRSPPTAAVVGAYTLPAANLIVGTILFILGVLTIPRR